MSVRAKFQLHSITDHANSQAKTLKFGAVTADGVPENERYHKYTPSGSLEIYVDNPPAVEQFKLGEQYYVDFTPAPK